MSPINYPIGVYLNWSAYDELSDSIELTEDLAMHQLDELVRLRRLGVQCDYYVMDAFWFSKDSGFREWRKPHWPQGPDRWIESCLRNGIKPGMWFGANNPAWTTPIPEWMDSFDPQTGCMCCFYGGFLPHYIETLHRWYERGIRLFKIDFADFSAAPPNIKESLLPSEIRAANTTAYRAAISAFRLRHPDVLFIAYNGFEERTIQNTTDEPLAKVVDTRWLEAFDSIYCGDPRPADVPAMNFWRSKDIYSDHMVRRYQQNGLPLARIDNAGFMIGTTGTCYYRGSAAWRGMLILSLARGGWINTYYGNLDLLSDDDARWFAQVQRLFFDIHKTGSVQTFGGLPGASEPYGYISVNADGALITVVNPSQLEQTIPLPCSETPALLFTDAGFIPHIEPSRITLGAEQMALLGYGKMLPAAHSISRSESALGIEIDVHIPVRTTPLHARFTPTSEKSICAEIVPSRTGTLRIVFTQKNKSGRAVRTVGGSPPHGHTLGKLLTITVEQNGTSLPVSINYDKAIWSGLSWAVGEVYVTEIANPIQICCATCEIGDVLLDGVVYQVTYA